MRTVGQAVSSAAVAAVLVHHTSLVDGLPLPTLHGYLVAFSVAAAVALAGSAVALLIPGDPAPENEPVRTEGARSVADGTAKEDA